MERNAHRLTLHSPAGESLRQQRHWVLDVDQLLLSYYDFYPTRRDFRPQIRRPRRCYLSALQPAPFTQITRDAHRQCHEQQTEDREAVLPSSARNATQINPKQTGQERGGQEDHRHQ